MAAISLRRVFRGLLHFFFWGGKEFFRHAGCEVPRGVWLRRDFAALNLGAGAEMEERGSRHGVLNRGAGLAAIGGGLAAGIAGPPNRPATGMGSGGAAVRSPGVRSGRALAAAMVLPGNYIPFTQACAISVDLAPTSEGVAPWQPGAVFHWIAPEFFERRYAGFPDIPLYETHPT